MILLVVLNINLNVHRWYGDGKVDMTVVGLFIFLRHNH